MAAALDNVPDANSDPTAEALETKEIKHVSKRFGFFGDGFARTRVVAVPVPVPVPVSRIGFAGGFANNGFGPSRFGFGAGHFDHDHGFSRHGFGNGFAERRFGDRFDDRFGDRFDDRFEGGFRRPFRSGPVEEGLEPGPPNSGVENHLPLDNGVGAGLRRGLENSDDAVAEKIESRFNGNSFSNRHKSDRNTIIVVAPNTNKITNDNGGVERARNIINKQKLADRLEESEDLAADSRDNRI